MEFRLGYSQLGETRSTSRREAVCTPSWWRSALWPTLGSGNAGWRPGTPPPPIAHEADGVPIGLQSPRRNLLSRVFRSHLQFLLGVV